MTTASASQFKLNGRHILAILFLFFGTVFSVNFYMAHAAITTFSGLEADKPYQDGLRYDDEIAFSRAQAKRAWRVDASVRPSGEGAVIEVDQKDAAGLATPGLKVTALFMHPADRRHDVKVELAGDGAGRFSAPAAIAPGRWDVLIEAGDKNAQLFRSISRIELAVPK